MADIFGTGDTAFTFDAPAVGRFRATNIFEAIAYLAAESGRSVFVGEVEDSRDDVTVPYAVVSSDWEPEPDIGGPLTNRPTTHKISVQINSYGREHRDSLWLDAAIYTLLMEPGAQVPGHRIVWRDGDESPVLTRTRYGLILAKHWYRFAYSRSTQ